MITRLLIFVSFSWSAFAANTTITQTVTTSTGGNANGNVLIRINVACQSGSVYVVPSNPVVVPFLNGAFSVSLPPNDTCIPSGTSYTAIWQICPYTVAGTLMTPCPGQSVITSWTETWNVTTSGTPLLVSQVVVAIVPTPALMLLLSQLANVGATAGQYICNPTGNLWQPCTLTGGGNVLSSGTPTNGQFAEWTNATTIQGASFPSACSGNQVSQGFTGASNNCIAQSGSVNYGVNSVSCTSSLTFNLNSALYSVQSVSLTCNITSMSFQNLAAGALVTFRFCRNSGNQSFSGWPGTVHGGFVNAFPVASTCDSQSFYSPDGTNLYSNGVGALNQP